MNAKKKGLVLKYVSTLLGLTNVHALQDMYQWKMVKNSNMSKYGHQLQELNTDPYPFDQLPHGYG